MVNQSRGLDLLTIGYFGLLIASLKKFSCVVEGQIKRLFCEHGYEVFVGKLCKGCGFYVSLEFLEGIAIIFHSVSQYLSDLFYCCGIWLWMPLFLVIFMNNWFDIFLNCSVATQFSSFFVFLSSFTFSFAMLRSFAVVVYKLYLWLVFGEYQLKRFVISIHCIVI
jgi:hypothetical protein